MSREKETFRYHLERLMELYPGRDAIGMKEACQFLRVDRRTLLQDRKFPVRKIAGMYRITLVNFAQYLSV